MIGTIVRVVEDRHFGFIRGNNGKDYFFHRSGFKGHWENLLEDIGNKKIEVEFDEVNNPRGPRAENVTRLDGGI